MSSRKCIYTGKDAECEDKVIPKNGGDEVHNWANSAPCSKSYKAKKALNHPSELEIQANRASKMLELAKLDARYWELELDRIRLEITKLPEKPVSKTQQKKKEKEIKLAYIEKDIKEVNLDSILEAKKMKW